MNTEDDEDQNLMAEDTSNAQVTEEPEKITGYVKNKVKSQDRPNRGSRARKEWRGSLAKIIKRAASIAELLTEGDQEENLRVIREAKNACHVYITKKGEVHVPDHKTRLAAVALDLAYREGKPVERQLSAKGDFKDFPSLIDRLNSSEAFRESYASLKKTLQGKEVLPALPVHDDGT